MRWSSIVAVGLALGAPVLAAQNYKGTGSQATQAFPLVAGVTVFEVTHRGEGSFRMVLLDDRGNGIDTVAVGTGVYGGSKAVRIPALGRYLVNVEATGSWDIRIRAGEAALDLASDPAVVRAIAEGKEAGIAAANKQPAGGWFGRGLVGGTVLGPVGAILLTKGSGPSADRLATQTADQLADDRVDYTAAFRDAFATRLRERRSKAATLGGLIGTGILAAVVFSTVVLKENGGAGGNPPPPPPPNAIFGRIPLPVRP